MEIGLTLIRMQENWNERKREREREGERVNLERVKRERG